jgi:DNA-binding CsgD family transcriptional regulator
VGLLLTADDTRRLAGLTAALLTPPAGPERVDAWWRGVEAQARELFPGAAIMYSLPHGERMFHLAETVDTALRREFAVIVGNDPATGRTRSLDPGLQAWHDARRASRVLLWNDVINERMLRGIGMPMNRLPWYVDGLIPAGMRVFSGLSTELPSGESVLCLGYDGRGRARRDAAEELELLRLLLPMFQASHHAWATFGQRQAALQAQLDAIPEALLVAAPGGRTLHRNAALERLLAAEPERDLVLATLHAMAAEVRAPRLVAAATPARTLATALGAYRLHAALAPAALWGVEGAVQLTVESARPPAARGADAVPAALGLTPREAEVAVLLARRARDPEIAAALGVSVHTARHHTEKVLRKLGLRRRTDVAAVLAGG